MRILIVEDEPAVASFLEQALSEAGYTIHIAESLEASQVCLASVSYDLITLDLMLPDGSGLEFLRDLRKTQDVPVLVLTARGATEERVMGLDAGADDYLAKPFKLEEFLARVRALLRRKRVDSPIRVADFELDPTTRRVMRKGRLVFLSTTEYTILELLARNQGEAVSKQAILSKVWDDTDRGPNVVEVYVNYLRNKLERGGLPRLIHTVRGKGYMLSGDPPE